MRTSKAKELVVPDDGHVNQRHPGVRMGDISPKTAFLTRGRGVVFDIAEANEGNGKKE